MTRAPAPRRRLSARRIAILALIGVVGAVAVALLAAVIVRDDAPTARVVVAATGAGLSAEQVERTVCPPLEAVLRRADPSAVVTALVTEGRCTVQADVTLDPSELAGIGTALARAELPDDAEMGPWYSCAPVGAVIYTLRGDHTPGELEAMHADRIADHVPAALLTTCNRDEEIRVEVDPDGLVARGVSLTEVLDALARGSERPEGSVPAGSEASPRTGWEDDLASIPVGASEAQVQLRDLATIAVEAGPGSCSAWQDGEPALAARLYLRAGSSSGPVISTLGGRLRAFRTDTGVDVNVVEATPLVLRLQAPAGTAAEELDALARQVGETAKHAGADRVLVERLSSVDEAGRLPGLWLTAELGERPAEERDAVARAVVEQLRREPGLSIATPPGALEVAVLAQDRGRLAAAADAVERMLHDDPRVTGVAVEGTASAPGVDLRVDREAVARAGLSPADVVRHVTAATRGVLAGEVRVGARSLPVSVHLGASRAPADLGSLPVLTSTAGAVPLSRLAQLEMKEAPEVLLRLDGVPMARLRISTAEPDDVWDDISDGTVVPYADLQRLR